MVQPEIKDEEIDGDGIVETMEGGGVSVSASAGTASSTASHFPTKPQLITHLSIVTEDSPLLGKPTSSAKRKRVRCSPIAAWKWYEDCIEQHPLLTKSITSGILTWIADVISQLLTYPPFINAYQSGEFFLLGLCLQAPVSHYYYQLLDRKLPPTPQPWTLRTLVKLLIDQLLFAPSFLLSVFLFLDFLEGRSVFQMQQHLESDFVSTLIANWKLWVPATLLNLAFVPPVFRVLYSNVVFFVWSIILAILLQHGPTTSPAVAATETLATPEQQQ